MPCSCSSNPFPTPADSTVERSNKCLILKVDHAIQFWASVLFHEMQKGTNSPSSDSSMGCHSQCLPSTLKVVGAAFSPTLRVLQPLSLGATLRWATTRRASVSRLRRRRRRRRPTDGRKCTPLGGQAGGSLSLSPSLGSGERRCGGTRRSSRHSFMVRLWPPLSPSSQSSRHTCYLEEHGERHEWNGPLGNINALHESGASLRP